MTSEKMRKAQADWIAAALKRRKKDGKTQKGLAEALGLTQSRGHRIASGDRPLRVAEIPLVERYLGERMPPSITGYADGQTAALPATMPAPDGFMAVPVYDVRAAAGAGAVAFDAEPIDHLMFREGYLRRVASGLHNLFVLEISGDSNWPFLHDRDHALVDGNQKDPRREGRYVIRIDDVLQVKLVSMHPTTRLLTVKADNPSYPSYDNLKSDEIAIVGRVIWIGRSLG
ncbi:MAG TPA: S24 family peptidase [Rhizomicrobium sp.]|jgi:phage repressor protein C with HTH and peptisase S24 domain